MSDLITNSKDAGPAGKVGSNNGNGNGKWHPPRAREGDIHKYSPDGNHESLAADRRGTPPSWPPRIDLDWHFRGPAKHSEAELLLNLVQRLRSHPTPTRRHIARSGLLLVRLATIGLLQAINRGADDLAGIEYRRRGLAVK